MSVCLSVGSTCKCAVVMSCELQRDQPTNHVESDVAYITVVLYCGTKPWQADQRAHNSVPVSGSGVTCRCVVCCI